MDVDTAKIICIVSMFLSTWFFTCVPYFLVSSGVSNPKHVRIRDTLISYLKCFAGGVFMSACFLNLIPEGMQAMQKYFDMIEVKTKFPAFMCIAALGFFIIAVVELFAHTLIHKAGGIHSHNHNQDEQSNQHQNGDVNNINHINQGPGVIVMPHSSNQNYEVNKMDNSVVIPTFENQVSVEMTEICQKHEGKENDVHLVSNGIRSPRRHSLQKVEKDQGHDEVKDMLTAMEANPLRAFLLLAAISFHTVFDGLAVGLKSELSDVWQMFTAIIIHKSLVSICLGLQLFLQYKDKPLRGVLWSLLFSVIAPFGLGIGMALTTGDIDETARHLTNTFLQGLATGTFIFVTFFEILKEEIVDTKGFKRLFLVALGFAAMGLIKYFT